MRLGDRGTGWLCRLTVIASFSSWAITLIKSFLGVNGVTFTGETANDIVHGFLLLLVVIPSFAASGLWVLGLWPGRQGSHEDVS